jgi:AcrR family transcriptional regulator
MAPRVVDKDEKRRKILKAAMKVFAKEGVKAAKVADIAVEAGVGKGTIYEYFRSRDEMLVQAFYLALEQMRLEIQAALEKLTDPAEKVKTMLRVSWDSFLQFPEDTVAVFLDFWSEGIRRRGSSDETSIGLKAFYAEYRDALAAVLQEGIDRGCFRPMNPGAVASSLMALIDGLLLQLIVDRQAFASLNTFAVIWELALTGIGREDNRR